MLTLRSTDPSGAPVDLVAAVERLGVPAAGADRAVVLVGVHDHAVLPSLIAALVSAGWAPVVEVPWEAEDPGTVSGAVLRFVLPDATPIGREDVAARVVDRRVQLAIPVDGATPADMRRLARAAADQVDRLVLLGDHPQAASLLDAAWSGLRGSITDLDAADLRPPPDTTPGAARALDARLLALRLDGGWLPGLGGGTDAQPAARARRLHALGMASGPPPSLPTPPPLRGRVVLLIPGLPDVLLATHTLPALARALRDRGADVRVDSVWHRPWNLHGQAPLADSTQLHTEPPDAARDGARMATARRFSRSLLDHLDLTDADAVIAPGWATALHALRHPTRRPGCTVHLVDLHLLDGAVSLSPWPDDLWVTSCFPGYLAGYLRLGVPVERLVFRPYPVPDTFVAEPDGNWLAAGNHRRDAGLLTAALDLLPPGRPIVSHSAVLPPPHPRLDRRPAVPLPALAAAVARSHGVILPVRPDPHDAAGISIAALALAAGRPIVGTTAWGLFDHVRHGEAGLLTAPDPTALAAALHAVDGDPALHARLAHGAAADGSLATAAAWADELLHGAPPSWPVRPTAS